MRLVHRHTPALFLVLMVTIPLGAHAQGSGDSSFADLRANGNDIVALRTVVSAGFGGVTSARAIATVSRITGLPVVVDSTLAGLQTVLSIAARSRTAAVALLEIGRDSHLRIRVSPRGVLEITAARDLALPAVRVEAARSERLEFESTPNVGVISMSAEALRASPAFVEPDLLRSIQALPGIAARSDWAAGYNVRGGEGDQSLVLMDGYPIYNPFHLGGVFSTFIDPMVGRVALRTGALPARYGGRLSGVLDVQSANPTTSALHGDATISLVSSSASLGRTVYDGTGGWMVAARRTYADAVVSLFKPNAFPYHFQDVQAHASGVVSHGVRLSGTAYAGEDASAPSDSTVGAATWGNSLVGMTVSKHTERIPRAIGDSIVVAQRASLTRFDANLRVLTDEFTASNEVRDSRVGGDVALHGSSGITTVGYELAWQRMSYRANASQSSYADILPFDTLAQRLSTTSLFADRLWRPSPRWLLDLGGRWESVSGAGWSGFSPRASIKYFLSDNTAITAGGGRYAQWMHSLGREEEPVQPLQFWVGSDSLTPVSLAHDAVVGVERWVAPSRIVHLETFYKRYDDLAVPNQQNDPLVLGDAFTRTTGTSYGVDLLLRQLEGGRFSGWLAYTYALGTRRDAAVGQYAPAQDRRHDLNVVGSWHGQRYTFGGRINLASGLPSTPVLGVFVRQRYDPISRQWIVDDVSRGIQTIPGLRNSARLPWYERIDVSASRPGRLFGVPLSAYLSVLNVLNAQNPAGYVYQLGGRPERHSFPNLPFTPTFGVTLAH